jgi:hypothetical protein
MPKLFLAVLIAALACAPQPGYHPTLAPGVDQSAERLLGPANPGATTPLSADDRRWIDRTMASLTLRQKIGQLMMPWVGGDYAAIGSAESAGPVMERVTVPSEEMETLAAADLREGGTAGGAAGICFKAAAASSNWERG